MDTVVFTDPAVIDYFTNEMTLVTNEAEKEDTALTSRYKVSGFPTLVMVDAKGVEIDRIVGFAPPEEFLKIVKDYSRGIGTLDDLLDSSKTTTDRGMFYTIAEKYQYRGKPAEAEAWYRKVVSAGSPTDSLSGASRMALAQMTVGNRELDKAATMYESIRTDFKGTPTEGEAALSLGLMYRSAMMWDKALATFDSMRSDFKGQNWEAEAAWFTCGLYLRKGDTATAVEHYRKMAEEFQNFPDPAYAKKANDQVANLTKPKTETMR